MVQTVALKKIHLDKPTTSWDSVSLSYTVNVLNYLCWLQNTRCAVPVQTTKCVYGPLKFMYTKFHKIHAWNSHPKFMSKLSSLHFTYSKVNVVKTVASFGLYGPDHSQAAQTCCMWSSFKTVRLGCLCMDHSDQSCWAVFPCSAVSIMLGKVIPSFELLTDIPNCDQSNESF